MSVVDQIEWKSFQCEILSGSGQIVFKGGMEAPASWSQNAVNILAQKYARKRGVPEDFNVDDAILAFESFDFEPRAWQGNPTKGETSAKQIFHRLAGCWAYWGYRLGYFGDADQDPKKVLAFYNQVFLMLANQQWAPNSPQWFNTGLNWLYGIKGEPQGHYRKDWGSEDPIAVVASTDEYSQPQVHACLPGHVLVNTNRGLIPIREIVDKNLVGLEVFDSKGLTKVLATKNNGTKQVFRVELDYGFSIEATEDHLVKVGPKGEWKQVGDLSPEDRMHLHTNKTPSLAYEATSPHEAALVGWLQTDGFVGQYKNSTSPSLIVEFQTINEDERLWIDSHLEKVFPDVEWNKIPVETSDPKVQFVRYKAYGERFRAFVERNGLLARSEFARVPEHLFFAQDAAVVSYLRSVFQADGCVRDNPASADIAVNKASKEFLEGVRYLLLRLGIYSSIQFRKDNRENRKDGYTLSVAWGSDRKVFQDILPFVASDKAKKLAAVNEKHPGRVRKACRQLRVRSVEPVGEMVVYDIQTESEEFLAQNLVVHNCYIQRIEDNLLGENGIFSLVVDEARLFKLGSGSGGNYSKIREKDAPLTGGGTSSGLMSFLNIPDCAAGAIKSGGTTRRAARMVVVDDDHPEVCKFVEWKVREENKVAAMQVGSAKLRDWITRAWEAENPIAILKEGAALNVPPAMIQRLKLALASKESWTLEKLLPEALDSDWQGEAYKTVGGQNANNSIRIHDAFFDACAEGADWHLTSRVGGGVVQTLPAQELFDKIVEAAWLCADPGLQYHDTTNAWHTCPHFGTINGSNPCSEYNFLDDTACNLGSANLVKFLVTFGDGRFEIDVPALKKVVEIATTILDISVSMAQYPSESFARESLRFRTLGLGYANLGSLLMRAGMRYGSQDALALTSAITAFVDSVANFTSTQLAQKLGAYPGYEAKHHLRVLAMHGRAARGEVFSPGKSERVKVYQPISDNPEAARLRKLACAYYESAYYEAEAHGMRNAQVTCIAPTGTIGLVMDCSTTGCEPEFAMIAWKTLAGGGHMRLVSGSVREGLTSLGYSGGRLDALLKEVEEKGTLEHTDIPQAHKEVFYCAMPTVAGGPSLSWEDHIYTLAAIQPYVSGGMSKTVNLPASATLENVAQAYRVAWELGVKNIAVYRDASKMSQPLMVDLDTSGGDDAFESPAIPAEVTTPSVAVRTPLPNKRFGYTQKVKIDGYSVYVKTGEYEDGRLGEIFINSAKSGSLLRGVLDAIAVSVSIGLQHGVPLQNYVDAFRGTQFEPAGFVQGHDKVRTASSLLDYIFTDLAHNYLVDQSVAETTSQQIAALPKVAAPLSPYLGKPCPHCDALKLRKNGTCEVCDNCGETTGCS